jgi:UDP-N-acetylmuramoyl-tripeptide--D-alanyl-D-alanine ligase
MSGPLDWPLRWVATITRGVLIGDGSVRATSVGTDSRTTVPGSLFVALRGERFDGHDHAAAAIAAGAVATVVGVGSGSSLTPRIEVEDTGTALRDLAAARRHEIEATVLAVTGSTGKTSTKDLLRSSLPESFASPRSFNNEVGVPLTVLMTPRDARHLVLEVGSRGKGHIAWLEAAVRPDVAVITNLGVVHLETFGTTDQLADAKWELVEQLTAAGTAVVPDDEPRLHRPHHGAEIRFGKERGDVAVRDVRIDDRGRPSFTLATPLGSSPVRLDLAGEHQALNAAAAAAAAVAVGESLESIVAGLESATGAAWRMEVHPGRFTVVNDAYNANPQSMAAALRTVSAMPGRHIAVLGEMAELGPIAGEEHERIGLMARDLGFSAVVTVGEHHGLADAAGAIASPASDAAEALVTVKDMARPGDVILVKASRAVGLEALAIALAEEAAS